MIKNFHLNRTVDDSGISGTGIIAEGSVLSNGKCIVSWLSRTSSVEIWNSVEDMMKIHGHGDHTQIKFI